MARRINEGVPQVELRPQTNAIADTFARSSGGSRLEMLAQGLSELNPSLGRFSQAVLKRSAEQAEQEGLEAARKMHTEGLSLAQLTREGKLPTHQNPWFMKGFNQHFGKVAADDWLSDFVASEASQEFKSLASMEDFDKYIQRHRKDWLEKSVATHNKDFSVGFGPKADAYWASKRLQFAEGLDRRIKAEYDNVLYADIKQTAERYNAQVDPAILVDSIERAMKTAANIGRDPKEVAMAARRAILAAAEDDHEFGLETLQLLGKVKDLSGIPLKDSWKDLDGKDVAHTLRDTEKYIVDRDIQANNRAHVLAERRREETSRRVASSALEVLIANNGFIPNSDFKRLAEMSGGDNETIQRIESLRKSFTAGAFSTDTVLKGELLQRIWNPDPGDDPKEWDIMGEVNKKLTGEDAKWLVDQLKDMRSNGGPDGGIFDDYLFKKYYETLPKRFTNESGLMGGALGDRLQNAQAEFRSVYFKLHKEGKLAQMGQQDRENWLNTESKRITEYYRQGMLNLNMDPARDFTPPEAQDIVKSSPFHTELLFKETDLINLSKNGSPSSDVVQMLNANKIPKNPTIFKFLLQRQMDLFKEKYERAPGAPKREE